MITHLGAVLTRRTTTMLRTTSAVAVLGLAAAGLVEGSADAAPQDVRQAGTTRQSARAAAPVLVPGRFAGLGFDTCSAPNQATMDELRRESPYWGVGVYIGGEERGCAQPNLDRSWVHQQATSGWHVFPLWAGRQSLCADRADAFDTFISRRNAKARAQGVAAANQAVRAARHLGIAKGSTLFLDVEGFDNTRSECNQPVLNFQDGWNSRLKATGWKGAFYSAGSSGIALLQLLHDTGQEDAYRLPTAIWISYADGKPSTSARRFIDDRLWRHQRLHQYEIDVTKTFGDVTLALDSNAIDVGGGVRAPAASNHCGGVRLDFEAYPKLRRGDRSTLVKAAQCLLKQHGHHYRRAFTELFSAATTRAVRSFQNQHDFEPTGALNAQTWTSLLSLGENPLSKRGSVSDRVRAIQRALTAATDNKVAITGIFTPATTSAATKYQRNVGLDANGIVGPATWKALQTGRLR